MIMSFNDFNKSYNLKNKSTSNIKIYQVLFSTGLDNVDIHLTDGPFSSDVGIVNLHPSKGTHRVVYINEVYFENYGFSPPQIYLSLLKKEMDIVYFLNTKFKV